MYYSSTYSVPQVPTSFDTGDASSWYKFITDFPGVMADFQAAKQTLSSIASDVQTYDTADLEEYQNLVSVGNNYTPIMNSLQSLYNSVSSWYQSASLSSSIGNALDTGLTDAETYAAEGLITLENAVGLNGLSGGTSTGIWVVAGALITIYAIGYWINDANNLASRVALAKLGYSPSQINATLGQPNSNSLTAGLNSFINIPWLPLAIVAAAIFIIPPLLKDTK